MGELKKGGIRAAMSENTEREKLKRMGQRGGETVSNDTQVKQEAPERVWITQDDAYPWPTPEMGGVAYVRADLLATVRREAFKEAIAIVMQRGEILHRGNLVAALEASATEKEGINAKRG